MVVDLHVDARRVEPFLEWAELGPDAIGQDVVVGPWVGAAAGDSVPDALPPSPEISGPAPSHRAGFGGSASTPKPEHAEHHGGDDHETQDPLHGSSLPFLTGV